LARTAKPEAVSARTGGGSAVSRKSFGAFLRDLLIERGYTTGIGNPNWSQFALDLGDIQYESLRKAVTGERPPSARIMVRSAEQLGVEPTVFWEYQLWLAQRALDPTKVGEEEAFANLQKWLGKS
jgi:hypothetical protein